MSRKTFTLVRLVLPFLAAAALAGCEHTGSGLNSPAPMAAAVQPAPEPPPEPMTEQRASAACWMKYERGRADLPLDARAALVDKCIDERMKAGR
jgi:hypothetical protein